MPAGTSLTFLFTDIVGSTVLWQHLGDAMQGVIETHDQCLTTAMVGNGGEIFAGGGDGFGVAFADPHAAVAAAEAAQEMVAEIQAGDGRLRVRMGMHTGPAQRRNNDYFGLAVNRAARISSAAHGDQILLSAETAGLVDETIHVQQLGAFRLSDLFEPVVIFQVGAGDFPPIRALDPERHNLPTRFTSLVGREPLINEVAHAQSVHRLVTLVGPGGIGKTTVALDVAAKLAPKLTHGAWLVELAELAAGDDIEAVVAEQLGLEASAGWLATAAQREQLLVLDNAEHVIDEVASLVARLLGSGAGIRCLVTTREALLIPGEHVLAVGPLPSNAEGAELFLDRAGTADLDPVAVERIVGMVDGMPLAIELVAARARTMALPDLLDSLSQHGLASFVTRGTSTRHGSSEAAVKWSFDLLAETERAAFLACGAFSQDFRLQDAAAVAEVPLSTVRALVEKSLLQRTSDRYRLLEPIREFAHAQASEEGVLPTLRRRLAHHVVLLIDEVAASLPPRAPEWFERLPIERADLIAAASELIEQGDADGLMGYYRALPGMIGGATPWSVTQRWLEQLEPGLPLLERDAPAGRWALFRHAWCEDMAWLEDRARGRAQSVRATAEAAGDDLLAAACDLVELKTLAHHAGSDPDHVEGLLTRIRSVAERSDWWEPGALDWLHGVYLSATGRYAEAEGAYRSALQDPSMKPFNRTISQSRLAQALSDQERHAEALAVLDDVPPDFLDAMEVRAYTLLGLGRLQEGLGEVRRLIERLREDGQPDSYSLGPAAEYFRASGDHATAVRLLACVLDGPDPVRPVFRRVLAEGRAALGDRFEDVWRSGSTAPLPELLRLVETA